MTCTCSKESEIVEMHTILKKMDRDFYGNGRPGIKTRFEQYEGALGLVKWVAGSGLVMASINLLIIILG